MSRLSSVLLFFALALGCGRVAEPNGSSLAGRNLPQGGEDFALRSDSDIQVISMQAWIDVMPLPGIGASPATRLQVRFLASSMGCTLADQFRIQLVQDQGVQILVIQRQEPDTCREASFRTEINHTVDGFYQPGMPVMLNGAEIPVFESIIN